LTDASWVEVTVDGKTLLSEELPKGTQKTISGKSIVVTSGNAGAVSIGANQAPPQAMGGAGAVETKTFGQP
jgi:cytoskeleton protein RodZ